MGESRTDLLNWVNNLLKLSYTKIEQMGTGSAFCQIFDSIYGDVQLNKVKFDAKQEYEYVANFKVLQDTFDRHKIDKAIPVDKLIKCKMQDNLEFSQWVKKHWDSTFNGSEYDAVARRKGAGATGAAAAAPAAAKPAAAAAAPRAAAAAKPTPTPSPAPAAAAAAAPRAAPAVAAPARTTRATTAAATATTSRAAAAAPARTASASSARAGAAAPAPAAAAAAAAGADARISVLETHVTELKVTVDNLEKERDFYFNKLRDIEVLVQTHDVGAQVPALDPATFLSDIKKILYSTEEGFELPTDAVVGDAAAPAPAPAAPAADEPEEF